MRLFLLLPLLCFSFLVDAQTCTGCKTTLNNYSGNLLVRGNESICLTGTFNGNIELNGGEVFICGNATIGTLTFKRRSNFTATEAAIVKIQMVDTKQDVNIVNYSDSLIIVGGNFNDPFNLTNHGKCYLNGGAFNNTLNFTNTDSLFINTNITVSSSSDFTNNKYMVINGNFSPNNSNVRFTNTCQVFVNGDMVLERLDINIDGGFLKVNNVNVNSGSITLRNAAIFYVNNLTVGGYINGTGSRSTIVCNQSPNLNDQGAIRGEVSVCVKNGNFVPNSGTVRPPASVDCNNPIGGSECNPIPFGYPYFRMIPQTSSDWDSSSTWQLWNGTAWNPAPTGRFPGAGSAVLIGDGKTMTITKETKVSRLILGETGNGKIVCSPTHIADLIVDDTTEFKNQSLIELNKSTLFVNGKLFTDLRCKGSASAKLSVHLPQQQKNLVMDQSVPGVSNSLYSLTINSDGGNLSLGDTLIIKHILHPTLGTITTNGKLVLRSDKDFTASIGQGQGNYIVGKVKVERYIPSIARRFRFVSPTIKNASLLEWQDDVYITGNNVAGTATGQQVGTLNSAGFDANQNFEPSMYAYDETKTGDQNNGWIAATNETNSLASFPLPVGKGYRLFIRGDRSDTNRLNGVNNTQNEVTIDMFGELVTGDVTVPITYTSTNVGSEDGWNLIGNPYASAYDWKTFYKEKGLGSDFEPNVWVYDSKTNAYVSYNVLAEAGSFTNGIIPSGQSFWVKGIGGLGGGKITLNEKYKIESVENDMIRATSGGGGTYDNTVSIRLIKDSVNQDEMILKFSVDAVKGVDSLDIDKFWSDQVGIAQFVGGQNAYLDLSTRPLEFGKMDSVLIYYFVAENGTYTLEMKLANDTLANTGAKAYLYDRLMDTFVNIATTPVYTFTVNIPNPWYGETDRFYIKYFPDTPRTVFVNYLYADKQDTTGVLVSWGSLSEPLPTLYTVQRGYDTTNFVTITTMNGTGGYGESSDYEFLDTLADLSKDMYYRIGKQDSINTQMTFSHTVFLSHINAGIIKLEPPFKEGLIVYPVPSQNMLTLAYRNKSFDGSVSVVLMDITGKKVMETVLGESGIKSKTLSLDISGLDQGIYFMQLTNKKGENATLKVVRN